MITSFINSLIFSSGVKGVLGEALKEYKGSSLLLSHKSEFYREVAIGIWNCEERTTKVE